MILRGGLCYFLVPSTYLLYLLEYLKTKFLATLKFCGSNFRRIRKTNPLGGSVSLLPSQPLIRIIRSCEEIVGKFDSSHRFDYYSQERAVRPKWFTHNSSIMWFERKLSFYSALRRKADGLARKADSATQTQFSVHFATKTSDFFRSEFCGVLIRSG